MVENYESILKRPEYEFIYTHKRLGKNVMLLGLAGSYAYGTNVETSDIDIRGITLNSKSDLIGMTRYMQYVDDKTDTTIYTFNKMIGLLCNCNPNVIELLGLKPEHYLFLSVVGQSLIDNRKMFLSKRAINSFGGYAKDQLRRLQNSLARDSFTQTEKEKHMLSSITNSMLSFNDKYTKYQDGSLKLYIDKSQKKGFDTEIFLDASLYHYPLRDYASIIKDMNGIIREFDNIGKRNRKKDDIHLNKHAMHLVRLFVMALDILEKEEIVTYRENEHDLLMSIRKGDYQKEDGTFRSEFYEMISDYERLLEYAAKHTNLPDEPNIKRIEEYVMYVNESVILRKE